jgi:3'-phosphoadenosine 5'-phosphosulfate sulfotransferase (PAPS reductase)/FAD synthetase
MDYLAASTFRLHTDKVALAVGISGGKDSCALGLYLAEKIEDGTIPDVPRVLIHSDLGRTEWKDSGPTCERLAKRLGWELIVVRRKAGDMLQRWEDRWKANVERYVNLECVKLILPWSTASMRFCTAELKRDVICADLVKRFGGKIIISASGIRRDESTARSKSPNTKPQIKLTSQKWKTSGFDWHPIAGWTKEEVIHYCEKTKRFPLHEAYTKYGSSRVSCAFCILGSKADLRAAAGCEDNHDLYRLMCELEIVSTFSFKENDWLSDVALGLLTKDQFARLAVSKAMAEKRQEAEARIPKHLEYETGWPTCIPTLKEAELLADVRNAVAAAVGLEIKYKIPRTIIARYEELMAEKLKKQAEKAAKEAAKPKGTT